MASTVSGLARTRSFRKPTASSDSKDAPPTRSSRIASPTRIKPPSLRPTSNAAPTATTAKSTRPISSGLGLGRLLSTRTDKTSSTEPAKTAFASSSKAAPKRPTTSGGIRPPASGSSTGGTTTRARAQTHTRTKSAGISVTSATSLPPPTGSQQTIRPVSVQSSTSSGSGGGSAKTVQSHRRQPSANASATSQPQPSSNTSVTSHHSSRPAFSTLQQHYSPAKNLAPKPSTASLLAPPSPSKLPANVAASAEISRLQTELLQLHLLHRDAEQVYAQWKTSAKQKLAGRFTGAGKAHNETTQSERNAAEEDNARALKNWGVTSQGRRRSGSLVSGVGTRGLEEKIQALDAVMTGLWTMGDTGGRYARVVRKFEKWASSVQDALESRDRARGGDGVTALLDAHPDFDPSVPEKDYDLFVGGLDEGWKEECAALYRKLDGWRRTLRELGDAEGDGRSALERILAGARELVHDMLAELDVMEKIEREAVAAENEWVRTINRQDDSQAGRGRAGAIWRAA